MYTGPVATTTKPVSLRLKKSQPNQTGLAFLLLSP